MLSTIVLVICAVVGLAVWILYKILSGAARVIGDEFSDAKQTLHEIREARAAEEREFMAAEAAAEAEAEWDACVVQTAILNHNRRYINSRRYVKETTFAIHYADGAHDVCTVDDGSAEYDRLMRKYIHP